MKTRSTTVRTLLLATGAAAALVATGCAKPTNVAVRTLDCPAEKIDFDSTWEPVYATGCGRADIIRPLGDEYASLRERAAFDLGCATKDVTVTRIDPFTYGVTGRGQRLVYKMVHGVGFTLDAVSTEAGVAMPVAAPADGG